MKVRGAGEFGPCGRPGAGEVVKGSQTLPTPLAVTSCRHRRPGCDVVIGVIVALVVCGGGGAGLGGRVVELSFLVEQRDEAILEVWVQVGLVAGEEGTVLLTLDVVANRSRRSEGAGGCVLIGAERVKSDKLLKQSIIFEIGWYLIKLGLIQRVVCWFSSQIKYNFWLKSDFSQKQNSSRTWVHYEWTKILEVSGQTSWLKFSWCYNRI